MPPTDRRTIFRGHKFDLALVGLNLPNGTRAERELVVHPGSVALLPLLDDGRQVVLIRNDRIGLDRVLWEIPAGTLEPGEDPDTCAARELREETGYIAGQIRKLTTWFVGPGVSDEKMHLYVCDGLKPGPPELQPDETIEPVVMPWPEALAMIDDGRIQDAKTALALLLWQSLSTRMPAASG
jgi:ADP-ribose pyrophosphatase